MLAAPGAHPQTAVRQTIMPFGYCGGSNLSFIRMPWAVGFGPLRSFAAVHHNERS